MVCKSCNTRLAGNERHCPNCGRVVGDGIGPMETGPQPLASASPSVDMDLDTPVPAEPKPKAPTAPARPARPAGSVSERRKSQPAKPGTATLFTLDPVELRARIAEHPELLEAGLSVWKDPKGRVSGADYETDIGPIDVLAESEDGSLVVIMVAERESEPVAETLERIGWVTKHLAAEDQEVRAIVLFEPPVPELGYAAKAVADTIAFRTWRVALAFDVVES